MPANAGNFTCSSQVKRSLAQFTCVTCSLPVNTGKFTCFEAASTSRRTHANCLNTTGILQVVLHAELMQICPRLACKIAWFCRQKYMQLTGKNTRIAGKNTRQTQTKITANAGKKPAQTQPKKPAIPRRITCNCRQSAITPRVNSPANCRQVNLHHAGEVTCNLRALLTAIACILCEVLAA